jgi:drug/metabolite transporter (DMT)-like permease
MPFFPTDPVTLEYVGASSGFVAILVAFLVALLPSDWRSRLKSPSLVLILLAGLNGLAVWVRALLGYIPQAGALLPMDPDFIDFVVGVSGFGTLLAIGAWAWARWKPRGNPDVDGDRWAAVGGGVGLALGIAMWFLAPGLQSK